MLCDYLARSVREVVFHKVLPRNYSSVVSGFVIFSCEISGSFCIRRVIESSLFSAENVYGVIFCDTRCTQLQIQQMMISQIR